MATSLSILTALGVTVCFSQCSIEGAIPVKDSDSISTGRAKRSDAAENPLYVNERKAYIQNDHSYLFPCTVVTGEAVDAIFWFRGKSQDPAQRELIIRQVYPDDGRNYVTDSRYQISDSHGIIIAPVNSNDTDRFWCKAVLNGRFEEDYLDVTVLGKTFPRESESTASNVTTHQIHEEDRIIKCPVLAEAPAMPDITLYWSLANDNTQNLDIIFASFLGGEKLVFPNYEVVGSNGLEVGEFRGREEQYCCHVFEKDSTLRTGCVHVTWLALAKQENPSISGCESAQGERCFLPITPDKDCAQYECSIQDVYPKPALNWSLVSCEEEEAGPTFVHTKSVIYSSGDQTYNVTSRLYIVGAVFHGTCEFTCSAYGDAIGKGTSTSAVFITRNDNAVTTTPSLVPTHLRDCNCKWSLVIGLTFVMAFLVYLLVFWFILIFPRNRRSIKKFITDLPTFPCLVMEDRTVEVMEMGTSKRDTDTEENEQNTKLDRSPSAEGNAAEGPTELSPMLTSDVADRGVSDEAEDGPLCLVIRGESDVLITDSKDKWRPMGEFVTMSALHQDNDSGFEAIKDIICPQDGGLFVIDAKGLHRFNSTFAYEFIDLYQTFWQEGYCSVTSHGADRLLFGLSRGKVVDYDIHTGQISNFGSVTRVRHTDVQLSDMSVDSLGFVFAGDRNGKAVSMFDEGGGCLTRMEIAFEPAFLHAHAHALHESQSLFVSSGVAVKKYNIVKSSNNSKILAQIRFTIDAESLGVENFHSGYVTVQGDELFVANHLEVGECLQILELDVGKGTQQHSIIVETLGLRGVKFMGRDRMVVFTDDSVYLFERSVDPNYSLLED